MLENVGWSRRVDALATSISEDFDQGGIIILYVVFLSFLSSNCLLVLYVTCSKQNPIFIWLFPVREEIENTRAKRRMNE